MSFDKCPIDGLGEEAVQVRILYLPIWAKQREVLPVSDPGHQRDPQQMSETKDGGALRLGVSMHRFWSNRRRLFLKHIENVGAFPDAAWDKMTEQGNVGIRDMVIPNAAITPIADMIFSQQVLFIHLPLGTIGRGTLAGAPVGGQMKPIVGRNDPANRLI